MEENINNEFLNNLINSENKILFLENRGWSFLQQGFRHKWFKRNNEHLLIDNKYF